MAIITLFGLSQREADIARQAASWADVVGSAKAAPPADGPDWRERAPRWFLLFLIAIVVVALIAVGGALSWFETGWRTGVNDHIAQSVTGYARLASVESEISGVKAKVVTLERAVNEMRRDQIDQWRWEAIRVGDKARVRELSDRLHEVSP